MNYYTDFACVYDRLMTETDYAGRTEYLVELFQKYDRLPTLLLDLACGTGEFSLGFQKYGMDVIGVDPSEEMLSVAREKAAACGADILFLCQAAENLDLYGTVDGAVCCLDSLNHITEYRDFCKAIERVTLFLETGRLFIFDLNTVYKHNTVLADHTFVIEQNDVFCVWQNETDPKTNQTDITLDFFIEENGSYLRGGEEFSEKAYTKDEIISAIRQAGLELITVLDAETKGSPTEKTEREIYITKKITKTKSFSKKSLDKCNTI